MAGASRCGLAAWSWCHWAPQVGLDLVSQPPREAGTQAPRHGFDRVRPVLGDERDRGDATCGHRWTEAAQKPVGLVQVGDVDKRANQRVGSVLENHPERAREKLHHSGCIRGDGGRRGPGRLLHCERAPILAPADDGAGAEADAAGLMQSLQGCQRPTRFRDHRGREDDDLLDRRIGGFHRLGHAAGDPRLFHHLLCLSRRVADGDDAVEPGDLEESQDARRGAAQRRVYSCLTKPSQAADEGAQPCRVDERHLAEVHDDGVKVENLVEPLAQLAGSKGVKVTNNADDTWVLVHFDADAGDPVVLNNFHGPSIGVLPDENVSISSRFDDVPADGATSKTG